MSPAEIQRFENEILGGQAAPPDLCALLEVAVSDGDSDAECFADVRAWLASCRIEIDANNWRELSTPEASTRPDKLHHALYEQKRIAAGSNAGD